VANPLEQRPFDNFRVAITDPCDFFGRNDLLERVQRSPFQVHILLGGRRIGKTSILRAVEWSLLNGGQAAHPVKHYKQQGTARSLEETRSGWVKQLFPSFSKLLSSQSKLESPVREGRRAFPVFINLQVEQPKDLDCLRYLFIARLREAMARWRQVPGVALREMYRQFLTQIVGGEVTLSFLTALNVKLNVTNPDHEQRLTHNDFRKALLKTINELQDWHFEGVCFLLDGAEFIVNQAWANDAWSYLRGLKDTDIALKPFVGFFLSGYRSLKEYQQAVGSPLLNIAQVDWLTALTDAETRELIAQRSENEKLQLTEAQIKLVLEWAGCHPYLTQQLLNIFFEDIRQGKSRSLESLTHELLRQLDHDFSAWWNDAQRPYSFGDAERAVYQALIEHRQGTAESLAQQARLSYGEVADSLDVLTGTGVILKTDDEQYAIGARIFEEWVVQQ